MARPALIRPAISTGVYRWPVESAAEIAVATVKEALRDSPVTLVRFVLFDDRAYEAFSAQL